VAVIGLKECAWRRAGDSVLIVCDPSTVIELADTDGAVSSLLTVLAEHPGDLAHLRERLATAGLTVSEADLAGALSTLDGLRLLVDRSRHAGADRDDAGRYSSNLAFFDLYASLEAADRDLQARLTDAHVLQLGTGGLGSNVLQSLAGLGVGRLTLLDADLVEPKNLARQFLYREDDFGAPKVERAADWVRAFNSDIEVSAVRRWVGGPDDLTDLLAGVDLVVSGIDQPYEIDRWVNEACVPAGVPWIRGGMSGSRLIYFSVRPGMSACYACRIAAYGDGIDRAPTVLTGQQEVAQRLSAAVPRVNRAVGPAAALIGSLVAFEAMRYLTGYEPPFGAGADVLVEVTGGCAQRREEWPRDPDCPVCARAGNLAAVAR
jgi:molybdopterin/thiamine biosynthesis adenylyltransferase